MNKVAEAMENDWTYLEQLLQNLISCYPTYLSDGSGIAAAQKIVKRELECCGFVVAEAEGKAEDIRKCREYVRVEDWGKQFENYSPEKHPSLIGRLEIAKDSLTLALNGHVDVEPVQDPSRWKYPELWHSGKIIADKIYGRGATDMLGGLAGMIFVLRQLKLCGIRPKINIVFHSVADEEIGGNGTVKCLLNGRLPDYAFIPEPTGLKICTASLGFHHFKVISHGKSVHMSQSEPGQNAIETAIKAYKRITGLRTTITKSIRQIDGYRNLKINPIVCGRIEGGFDPAIPAESCVFEGVVFSASDQSREQIKKIFKEALSGAPKINASIVMTEMSFPGASLKNEAMVRTLTNSGKTWGYKIREMGFPSPCDMRLYASKGVPTVIFGPGELTSAHAADESLDRGELRKFCRIFARFLMNFDGKNP